VWDLFRPNKLSGRIILLLLLLEFSSISFWGGLTYLGAKEELQRSIGHRLHKEAQRTNSLARQFFLPIIVQGQLTAQTLNALTFVKQRQSLFYFLIKSRPEIGAVFLLEKNGQILNHVSRTEYTTDKENSSKLQQMSTSELILSASKKGVSFGPVSYSNYLEPEIDIAIPVRNSQQTLLITVKLRWLWDLVEHEKIDNNGYVYILDQEKQLIAHPDPSLVRKKVSFNLYTNGLFSVNQEQANEIHRYRSFLEKQVIGAAYQSNDNNWWFVVELPVDEGLAPLQRIINRFVLAMGFALLFTLAAVLYFSRLTTRPLEKLEQGVKRFASGETNVSVAVPNISELASLARAFNQMAQRMDNYILALRDEKERAQVTLHSLGDAVIVTDATGIIEYLNPNAEKLTGWQLAECQGKKLTDVFIIIDALHRKPVIDPVEQVVEKGCVIGLANHTILLSREGKEYQIADNASPIYSIKGILSGVVLVFRDVTEEYKMRQAIERSERNLRSITDATSDGIIRVDERGCIIFWNPGAKSLFGYSENEVIGKSVHQVVAPESLQIRADNAFEIFSQTGQGKNIGQILDVLAKPKNGSLFPAELSLSAINTEQGWHAVGLIRDVSKLKQQQKRIECAAREEKLFAFLLALSLKSLSLKDYLKQFLVAVVHQEVPLRYYNKGAFLLKDIESSEGTLRMFTSTGFDELKQKCDVVPFGRGPCGKCAAEQLIQYTENSDIICCLQNSGLDAYGQFSLPLISSQAVLLGVMVFYRPKNNKDENEFAIEKQYLKRISNIASMGISHYYANSRIEYQAQHDILTNLPNRRLLEQQVEEEINHTRQHNTHGALLYIDLDNFKVINDSLGHTFGDQLIQEIALRLQQVVDELKIMIAREGGDEFVILIPAVYSTEKEIKCIADEIAIKLHSAINMPLGIGQHEYLITASIGIAHYPEMGATPEDLIRHADTALYKAKSDGRDMTRCFAPAMDSNADEYLLLENQLRHAVKRNELITYFQPQLNCDEKVIGAEVLLRWMHPELGMISPAKFIPIAEESGLIISIGEWLLQSVAKQLSDISNKLKYAQLETVSINISPNQFYQPDFAAQIETIFGNQVEKKPKIILEITEGLLLRNMDETINKMTYLKKLGFHFSIDDFGTGYSSLSYIQSLPIDELKIDQSFVRDMHSNIQQENIVEIIILLAKKMGLCVVAEGVENLQQVDLLKKLGCDIYQGFYFSKPVPENEFLSFLQQH
jgi:diguanylate cyclase (GGDEF)-like protein/PAS domain S-box-containing protein